MILKYFQEIHENNCHLKLDSFFEFINKQHPNLKFTIEIGSTKLPFLDIQIEIIDTKFIFTVYRKKTFTGLLLNFHAKCPLKWKIGLVNGMLHRAYSICSSWKLIHLEFEKIFDILMKNNYSREFLENILKSFSSKKFNPFCNPD